MLHDVETFITSSRLYKASLFISYTHIKGNRETSGLLTILVYVACGPIILLGHGFEVKT